jgi:hypothetical protein
MSAKAGVKGYIWDYKDFESRIEQAVVDAFSKWQQSFVIPSTRFQAPIYSGPDPREQYHPKGMLKQYIGSVQAKTLSGKTYTTCGIPGATGLGQQTDPDRAWIVTQVLHRGWTAPKARYGPMQFPVLRSELRNPEVEVPPPAGMPEDGSVAWIFITYAKAQSRVSLNRFHIRAFENLGGQYILILKQTIKNADIPSKTRKIRISVMK